MKSQEVELSLLANDMIMYAGYSKESTEITPFIYLQLYQTGEVLWYKFNKGIQTLYTESYKTLLRETKHLYKGEL